MEENLRDSKGRFKAGRIGNHPNYYTAGRWNKGQTKYTSSSIARYAEKLKTRTCWAEGLTKETDSRIAAVAEMKRGVTKENSIARAIAGKKISIALKGRTKYTHEYLAKNGIRASEALKGRSKETHPYLAAIGDKTRGRTKYNYPSKAVAAEKVSKALLGRTKATHPYIALSALKYSGELNHNWNGGSSVDHYGSGFTRTLRRQIKERDNYTCQKCGKRYDINTKLLAIHHINYDKKDHCNDNLFTLCMTCNTKVNTDRVLWKNYFDTKMRLRENQVVFVNSDCDILSHRGN